MDFYEIMLQQKLAGGGGGDVSVESLDVTENGTYTADEGHAYSPVTVSVPNSYTALDEGKVVNNGTLVGQTSVTKTANGTYNTTLNNEVVVNVPQPSGSISITENGTVDVTSYASANVNVSSGGSASSGGVNFYDYDGTIVESYTADEFAALSAMPSNPSHTGLTAQGWNWSLADAKAYVAKYGALNIGQMYVTTSGDTEIDIELHEGRLEPVLGISPVGTVEIDWGDGSAKDTVTGTSQYTTVDTQHIYASEGKYTIKLHVASGSLVIYGDSSKGSQLLHKTGTSANEWKTYQNAIQAIRIGNNTIIEDQAFRSCSSLTSITIPNSVTRIGGSAFFYCYSLASVTIPDSVTTILGSAFYFCYSLTSITIPNSVTNIVNGAFQNCYSLTSIIIPDSITSIGNQMFKNCYSLASIIIPDSVTSIGPNAFNYCYSLASVTIPDNVTSIGNYAFSYCHSLASIMIPDDVISIRTGAFYNCQSLASVTISDNVTSIEDSVFGYCYSLTSITIPDDVTSIGSSTFDYCYSLASITIPNDVTSIGGYAFENCYSLASITIPDSVTSIGSNAFNNCYGIKAINLEPTTPPTLSSTNAFNNIPSDCVFYVPSASLEAYQTATNWSTYADKMIGK